MASIGMICACSRRFLRPSCIRMQVGYRKVIRLKSSETTSVVVEKEKRERKFESKTINWDVMPKKIEQAKDLFLEAFKHPSKQRGKSRMMRDDEVLYCFRGKDDLENWFVHTDEVVGGKSWGEFVLGENGLSATFRGYTSQRLPRHMLPSHHDKLTQKHTFTGYACLQTLPFLSFFNQEDYVSLIGFNVIELRLRGDGRRYMFEAHCDNEPKEPMYTIPVHTKGGPEWQTVRIPYSKLICSHNSCYTLTQPRFDINVVRSFRFLLLDGIQGPFQLELDYIGLVRDATESGGESDYCDPFQDINKSIGTW